MLPRIGTGRCDVSIVQGSDWHVQFARTQPVAHARAACKYEASTTACTQ